MNVCAAAVAAEYPFQRLFTCVRVGKVTEVGVLVTNVSAPWVGGVNVIFNCSLSVLSTVIVNEPGLKVPLVNKAAAPLDTLPAVVIE